MTIKTDLGYIEITTEVLAGIAGYAASLCFGVKGMAYRSMTDGIVHLLRPEAMSKGVTMGFRRLSIIDISSTGDQPIYNEDESISIELHIIVENGVNIATVCRSIMGEVKYVVSKNTGVEVRDVNVCVDSITM